MSRKTAGKPYSNPLSPINIIRKFAGQISDRGKGTRCDRIENCQTLSEMLKAVPSPGNISLFENCLPEYKSVAVGLCCSSIELGGKFLWEYCQGYKRKGEKSEEENIGDLPQSEKYAQILQTFNARGWRLYLRKMVPGKIDSDSMIKTGPIREFKASGKLIYVPWPRNFLFGDYETLIGTLVRESVRKSGLFEISISCPKSHSEGLACRTGGESYKKEHPDTLLPGKSIEFKTFKVSKKNNDVQLSPVDIHMPLDDFLIALQTLENISKQVKDGPGETPPLEEDETGDEDEEDQFEDAEDPID